MDTRVVKFGQLKFGVWCGTGSMPYKLSIKYCAS